MGKKIYLNEKQAACIIHGLAIVISTADCPVEGHDSCDCTVDFLCGFFLIFHDGRKRPESRYDGTIPSELYI